MSISKYLRVCFLGSVLLLTVQYYSYSQVYWQPIAESIGRNVQCFYTDTETNLLYIGGSFNRINGELRTGIAAYDGSNFYPLGCGVEWDCVSTVGTNYYISPVMSITKFRSEIYAGGYFDFVDSCGASAIARWNGNNWNNVLNDANIIIKDMLVFNDELYVVGMFFNIGNVNAQSVAKWDGTQWSDVGDFYNFHSYSSTNNIFSIVEYRGEIIVGGIFQDSLGVPVNVMRYDGTNWHPVGGGTIGQQSIVYDLEVYHDELYVGGYFTKSNGNTGDFIQKWNGQNWSEVGGGVWNADGYPVPARKFYVFNDELYVIGDFDHAGTIPAKWMAKWDGTKWCSFPTDLFPVPPLAISSYNSQIIVGGSWFFTETDSISGVAKWTGGNYVDTCSTVGVNVVDAEPVNLQVFPIPASTHLHVKLGGIVSGSYSITLYDLQGKSLYTIITKEPETILDISQLPVGVYGVRVVGNGMYKMEKVVKMKE